MSAAHPDDADEKSPSSWWKRKHVQWLLTFIVAAAAAVPGWIAQFWPDPPKPQTVVNVNSNNAALPAVGGSPGQPNPQIDHRCDGTTESYAGWGPDRPTVQGPSTFLFYPGFNADRVNPNVGDERDMVGGRRAATNDTYSNDLTVEDGAIYTLRIYIHNSAADSDETVATGTRVRIPLPTCQGKNIAINGFINSRDAFPIEVWGGVNLKADRDFKITYVPDSAVLNSNGLGPGGLHIPGTDFLSEPGQLVGYSQLDGEVRGNWGNDEYFTLNVKVTMK